MGPLLAAARTADPWAFHLHADVFLVISLLCIGYREALRRLGPRLAPAGEPPATRRQKTWFGLGAGLMFVFAFWPIHDIAEDYLFSVHMTQHTVFSLVAVPLLVLGTPGWLVSWIIRPVLPVMRKLVRPLPASLLYNSVIAISHAAVWVNFTSSNELPHFLAHVLLVTTAAIMWLPAIHDRPELPNMSAPVKMVYLFAQSLIPNVPSIFLAFADEPLYQWYAQAPRIWEAMGPVEDQQLAGAIMKTSGTMILWGIIVVMFFRWYRDSERNGGPDVLRWEDVERELARTPAPAERTP
jgi:putative membrane protein